MVSNIPMFINSPDFEPFGKIPDRFTCDGDNINPNFEISRPPQGTKSFALIVDDVDAITPEGPFVHWVIWNIKPDKTKINENSVPSGAVEGINSAKTIGWSGPCPPEPQPHHYRFKVFALNEMLNISPGSTKFELEKAMKGKIIKQSEVIGEYERTGVGS